MTPKDFSEDAYDVEFVQKFTFRDDRLAAVHIVVAAHAPPAPGPA